MLQRGRIQGWGGLRGRACTASLGATIWGWTLQMLDSGPSLSRHRLAEALLSAGAFDFTLFVGPGSAELKHATPTVA